MGEVTGAPSSEVTGTPASETAGTLGSETIGLLAFEGIGLLAIEAIGALASEVNEALVETSTPINAPIPGPAACHKYIQHIHTIYILYTYCIYTVYSYNFVLIMDNSTSFQVVFLECSSECKYWYWLLVQARTWKGTL